jgi:RimJ/RimL family protein N-acetyltransferase
MKLRTFFRFAFGSLIVHENVFVFETSRRTKHDFEIVDRAQADVKLLSSKSKSELKKLTDIRFRKEEAERRFKAGHLCFVAEKNGHVINYVWVSFKPTHVDELEREIQVSPRSAYRYDGYTVPEYRGLGVLPVVLTRVADYIFKNGIEEIYDIVVSSNVSSLRAHEKIGSRKMGQITLVKLFKSSRYACMGSTADDCFRLKKMFNI